MVIIPHDICPKFGGWIAKTQDAQVEEDLEIIKQERECKNSVLDARGAQRLAEKQLQRSLEALDKASWLAKWGLPIGFVIGALSVAGVSVLIYSVVHNGR